MRNFTEALAAIDRLKSDGVVADYAIGGAMALVFWSEPIPTFDLDVFVLLPSRGPLEHIVIAGLPVQVIPAHNALAVEAIASAAEIEFEGEVVPVMRPEYLIALTSSLAHEVTSGSSVSPLCWKKATWIDSCSTRFWLDMASGYPAMSDTVANILQMLRSGKRDLRVSRRNLPLPEKVAQVVELQKIVLGH